MPQMRLSLPISLVSLVAFGSTKSLLTSCTSLKILVMSVDLGRAQGRAPSATCRGATLWPPWVDLRNNVYALVQDLNLILSLIKTPMKTITLVQKIKSNGELCAKSAQVITDLTARGLRQRINHLVPASEGYTLASKYQIDTAPFFIVTTDDGATHVYPIYSRFLKNVFNVEPAESDEIAEIMAQNSDMYFI